jgi:YbbR domain-containing protein
MSVKQGSPSKHMLKVISLIVSMTLWFYVLNSEPLEVDRRVPLVFIKPPGLAINVEIPKSVKVKVKGSRAFVQGIDLSQEKLIVDLKDFPYSQETFAVTFESSMVRLPFGVEVLEIQPKQVMLSLEREINKFVPVRVRSVGEIGKDLKLVQKSFKPKRFKIRGPYTVLKKIGLLETVPVDLSTLEGEGGVRLGLEKVDGRVLIEDKKDIEYSYLVKPNKANFTLKNVEISFLTKHTRFKASSVKAALDVLVSDGQKSSFTQGQVKVIAEIPDSKRGNVKVKLRATLPDGVNLLQIHPEFINVSLQ